MFGIIISASITAFIGVRILKRFTGKASLEGTCIYIAEKQPGHTHYPRGGFIFGIGWGIIGLCPRPIFALMGTGSISATLVLVRSLFGTLVYAVSKERLP